MDIVTPSFLVVLAFVVGGGVGIYLMRKIVKSFMRRQYGVDVLAFLAIAATLLASEYLATLIIVLMLVTGELLERYAGRRARRELSRLITHRPKYVHLVGGRDVLARKIKVGRRFFVKTGEMILLDGVLVSDVATLDTANITGEAAARTFTRNAHLVSGSLNIGAPIVIRATARLVDSQFSQLEKAVSDIEKHPAPFVRLADRYAVPFTVISLVIAGAAWVISGDFSRFAEVLVLASPCPLILAAPIAYISGMSKAFGRGILVKNGTYLEKLGAVKSVAFDKTGTLSRGKITVSGVVSLSKKYTAREVLKIAASCEVGSVHILARAIVDYAWDRRVKLAFIADLRDHLGFGIDARINGQTIVIGSLAHMRAHAIPLCRQTSAASIYLAVDRRLVGRIDFHDTLRAGALTAIHTLETLGIAKIVMVTGDNSVAAERVAGALGIGEVYAGKLPMDKVKIIQALEPKPTLYVGDGTNDAPTLAVADASIAMGAFGSPLSIDSAGIVIMSSDIGKIPVAIKIARATEFVAARSVFLGIGACLVLMLIATTGVIPAVLGAILQEVIDAASICSALAGEKVG